MRHSEWVVVADLVYLTATACLVPLTARRRLSVAGISLALVAITVVVALLVPQSRPIDIARDWLSGALMLAGYWIAGLLFTVPRIGAERWLEGIDRAVFDAGRVADAVAAAPRLVLEYFELAYLLCYPLVPLGLAVLYATGNRSSVDRYWTVVLTSAFITYGVLPWVGTRPPRRPAVGADDVLREMNRRPLVFRRVNLAVLGHASIQVNTCPSGHAASTVAATLAIAAVDPRWAVVFGIVTASICIGAVLGRYHYVVDVVLGAAVAGIVYSVIG